MGFKRIGSTIIGSPDIQTSTANQELIQTGRSAYKLKFYNQDACRVIINNTTTIYLGAYQGFETNEVDQLISSFKIVESGIKFTYVVYH